MRRLPVMLAAVAALTSVAGAGITIGLDSQEPVAVVFGVVFGVAGVANALTGAIVTSKVPANPVGWIILGLGLGIGVTLLAGGYGEMGTSTPRGPLPGDEVAAWVGDVFSIPVFFGLPAFLLLLFPTGRLLTPRWRPFAWACGAVITTAALSYGLSSSEVGNSPNPFEVSGAADRILEGVSAAADVLGVPTMLTCALAVALRLRRSRGLERQQLKGFAFVAALAGTALGATVLSRGLFSEIAFGLSLLGVAAMPVTAGVAVLRYRLYDIDVVIKRTLVYATLTAVLVATYLLLVLTLQALLRPVAGDSDLAVAASTLAVAALFRPLRAAIQHGVDRRFFRSRYDAAHTLDTFSERLRHELDLDSLGADLRAVVDETMQPQHVTLWLRRGSAS